MSFTIGSLFDGSGGFPLAAFMCSGTPVWASEIEPYPIAVTKTRFPYMKHLGSVTDIKGNEVEPVDVITFGSPCQDLSVAGLRKGLKHEDNGDEETTRSGLFMEAVRIIREMREATNGKYPRFALWENVPGAFSSNKGDDFRVVLEELIKIVEPTAIMPSVPKAGWPYADHYCGDGWSLAYRVLDAQFWGVPQRRRRVYALLDLGGQCAGEILFKREGLRGYFEEGRTPWQTVTGDAEDCPGTADCETDGVVPYTLKIRSGCEGGGKGALIQTDKSATLSTLNDQYLFQPVIDRHILDDQGGQQITVREDGKCPTLRAEMHGNIPAALNVVGFDAYNQTTTGDVSKPLTASATDTDHIPVVFDARGNGDGKICPTITGDHNNRVTDYTSLLVNPTPDVAAYGIGNGQANQPFMEEKVGALNCMHDQQAVCYRQGGFADYIEGEVGTLRASGGDFGGGSENLVRIQYIVRRLTPTECARLQGFPDGWAHPDSKSEFTDEEYEFWLNVRNTHAEINGKTVKSYTQEQMLAWYNKLHTDSAEYKLWGNGIALPCALYVMQGFADVLN